MTAGRRTDGELTVGEAAMLACLLEVSVPKVGNVHRSADFEDSTFYDFLLSAVAIGRIFDAARELSIGELIFRAVSATNEMVGTNTNLGMVLLMAPLAKCDPTCPSKSIEQLLAALDLADRDLVCKAIRMANPGGLGNVAQGDIFADSQQNLSLIDLMKLAQERDTVARQYATGFQELIDFVLPTVCSAVHESQSLPDGLVLAQLKIMAKIPDSLIARKCGSQLAQQSSLYAARITDLEPGSSEYFQAIEEFDFWLRCDGHRRNPGTSADLVAAGLFLGMIIGSISKFDLRGVLKHSRQLSS